VRATRPTTTTKSTTTAQRRRRVVPRASRVTDRDAPVRFEWAQMGPRDATFAHRKDYGNFPTDAFLPLPAQTPLGLPDLYWASHIRIARVHGGVLCASFALRCGGWGKRAEKCMNEMRGVSDQFKDAYVSPLRFAGSLALLALLAASLDCSSTSCVPGASVACVGAAGCTGGQVCTADGEGYGPCMCGADSGGDAADTDSRPLDATMDHELHDATIDHEPRDAPDATDETIEVEDTKPMDGGVVSTPCSSATDCPPNEACEASVCSTSCSASSPCNGGCCDGTSCQIGKDPTACGEGGGLCASCPLGQACTTGACSTACGASSSACNGGCCDGAMCQPGSDPGACGVTGGSCVTCSGASACLPTGKCGCASASECGEGQACTDGGCSAVCSDSSPCNGAC
jgi:hypothetical protein